MSIFFTRSQGNRIALSFLVILLSSNIICKIMLVSVFAVSAPATGSVSDLLSFRCLGDMVVLNGVWSDVVDIGGG